MEAIVFANRSGTELAPLYRGYCPALLPVRNRAVIEHTLDDLARAGVSRVRLVVAGQARQIEALVGNGEKWGLSVQYHLSKTGESVQAVVAKLGLDPGLPCLFVRGDVLRSPILRNLVSIAATLDGEILQPLLDRRNAGIAILMPSSPRLRELEWPLSTPADTRGRVIPLLHGRCNLMNNWQDLLDANLLTGDQALPGTAPAPGEHGRHHTPAMERCLALLALTLALPLAPLWVPLALLGGRGRAFQARRVFSNGGHRRLAYLLQHRHRGLALLPLLVLVARGDLRLFGADPFRPGSDNRRRGVLGPVQLWLGAAAAHEADIVERHFRTLSPRRQLGMLWRWRRQARRRASTVSIPGALS